MQRKSLAVAIAVLFPISAAQAEDSSLLEVVQPYGLLKPILAFEDDSNNKLTVTQSTSRFGVRLEQPFANGITAFGQAEYFINIVNNNDSTNDITVAQVGGSGAPIATGSDISFPVSTRLGYVALLHDLWSISLGKQWGVYSDVAGFTDWFPFFGGEASGIYTGGTDGGVTGTGRAAQAVQFRTDPFGIDIGLQGQFGNIGDSESVDDKQYFDTYSGSLRYTFDFTDSMSLGLGAAYTRNEAGATDVNAVDYGNDIPLKNADAVSVGVDFYWAKFRVAFTYNYLDGTELDNEGFPIKADGYELFTRYRFTDAWELYGGFNYLDPDNYSVRQRCTADITADAPEGCAVDADIGNFFEPGGSSDFEIKYFDIGAAYYFAKSSSAFIELVIEDSDSATGDISGFRPTTLGVGMQYSFGY